MRINIARALSIDCTVRLNILQGKIGQIVRIQLCSHLCGRYPHLIFWFVVRDSRQIDHLCANDNQPSRAFHPAAHSVHGAAAPFGSAPAQIFPILPRTERLKYAVPGKQYKHHHFYQHPPISGHKQDANHLP